MTHLKEVSLMSKVTRLPIKRTSDYVHHVTGTSATIHNLPLVGIKREREDLFSLRLKNGRCFGKTTTVQEAVIRRNELNDCIKAYYRAGSGSFLFPVN